MQSHPGKTSASEKCNSSMQLTRAADYAVRVMIFLATQPEDKRSLLPDLALATEAPESFLSKVLQSLAHAGLISSRRGKLGGFAIRPVGRKATMREVIEAIDGPICLNVCLNSGKDCDRKATCPAHPVWARAQRAMLDILMSVTVSAMAARAAQGPPSTFAIQ
jgi:Rrf2 family iron-sulfur cluster assembly transcriptional regulator